MNIDEARQTIHRAWQLGLSGAQFISALGAVKVAAAYNGIGPKWLGEDKRKKLGKWLKAYAVPCVIHDCRFTYDNDGSDAKFRQANDELERNCVIVADSKYAWYNPLRYWARAKGRAIAQTCRIFGWSAWRDAYDEFRAGARNAGTL
jgi:hypothetical protein